MTGPPLAIRGRAIHAPVRGEIEIIDDALIAVGADGRIGSVAPAGSPEGAAAAASHAAAGRLIALSPGQFLLPGLVDLHLHAPQFPMLGKALDLPLENWLQDEAFPLEARYADTEFAARVYRALVARLLANGTTTAMYYGTIHLPACRVLADLCLTLGQRALIGRVAMDDPSQCPAYYRDASAADGVAATRRFIDEVRSIPGNENARVLPAITPRFIPACTDALLAGLGALARETGCHVQTHCAESDWEHDYVRSRCGRSDAAALGRFGLLTRRTILAHGNFLSDADLDLLYRAGAALAHCPLSNVYFAGAVFPLRAALERDIHLGLGSDIAGGATISILDSARQAIAASRLLESGVDARRPAAERGRAGARIGFAEAFWLATAGGGIALDLPVGVFREHYAFDAVLIDPTMPGGGLDFFDDDNGADRLQKTIYGATPANIRRVWVDGTVVHRA
jgi:guanine deaminase